MYRTLTDICAPCAVTFATDVVTMTGTLVGVAPGAARGTVVGHDPDGAMPGGPYFQASCAVRSVCSASNKAAAWTGPA